MDLDRLPPSVTTLYAEAMEQALALERRLTIEDFPAGSLVSKTLRGRTYLYWQLARGRRKWQRYLGPDTPQLRRDLEHLRQRQDSREGDATSLERLAAMLRRGGAAAESAATGAIVELLAQIGVFRRGAVLVGTQAFRCYGNLLGVRFPGATGRTEDIDIAQDSTIALVAAAADPPQTAVESALARLGMFGVPGLDPREASTSFTFRGREVRVDFLTPERRGQHGPVRLRALGVHAQPLPFLDFLIADPIPAVLLARTAVVVRLPEPARYALHKLWIASERPTSQQVKARKDRAQAETLLAVLIEDRPGDLSLAWNDLAKRPRHRARIARELKRLPAPLGHEVLTGLAPRR